MHVSVVRECGYRAGTVRGLFEVIEPSDFGGSAYLADAYDNPVRRRGSGIEYPAGNALRLRYAAEKHFPEVPPPLHSRISSMSFAVRYGRNRFSQSTRRIPCRSPRQNPNMPTQYAPTKAPMMHPQCIIPLPPEVPPLHDFSVFGGCHRYCFPFLRSCCD